MTQTQAGHTEAHMQVEYYVQTHKPRQPVFNIHDKYQTKTRKSLFMQSRITRTSCSTKSVIKAQHYLTKLHHLNNSSVFSVMF